MSGIGFPAIVGQQESVRELQNALREGRPAHAYLFTGEPGSGRKMLATAFAAALLCEAGGEDSCGECASCRSTERGTNPDLLFITHEKPELITVREVREQLVDSVSILPFSSRYKVYILPDAEKMNPQAQNAILKTIEEPPAYVIVILLAEHEEGLLPTIRSRCIRIPVRPLRNEEVDSILRQRCDVSEERRELAVTFARGNAGKAIAAAEDSGFGEMTETVLRLVRELPGTDACGMEKEIRLLGEQKERIYDILSLLLLYYRDLLVYKASQDPDGPVFRSELGMILSQAAHCSYEGLREIIDAVQKAERRLRANVNFDLALELLFLTVRENIDY